MIRRLAAIAVLTTVTGCASVTSSVPGRTAEGLVYHLPRRDIVLTVAVDKGAITAVSADVSAPYADTRTAYVLGHQRNPFAESHSSLTVSEDGLLSGATSKSTPKLVAALNEAADNGNKLRANLRKEDKITSADCARDGQHVFVEPLPAKASAEGIAWPQGKLTRVVCDGKVTLTVERLWNWDDPALTAGANARPGFPVAGIYFRQGLPYRVIASAVGVVSDVRTVSSPSAAPTRFLALGRELFGSNDSILTMSSGSPATVVRKGEGEAIELVKLPAAVLRAYFAAVGAVIGGRSATDDARAAALRSQLELDIMRVRFQACMDAAAAQQADTVERLGCLKK